MKKFVLLAGIALSLCGCLGTSSSDNELSGQVKKVHNVTPFLFPNYQTVDVSLGFMRNGVGSMSHEDITLYVPRDTDFAVLKKASESGQLVKLTYDTARARLYEPDSEVTHVEVIQ